MVRRFSLLIADEDTSSRNTLGDVLEREGYRVFRSASGLETIALAKEQELHGLVIDMHMTDLSGIETLQKLKQEMRRIPSILISVEPWKELQIEALAVGVFSFIQKPVQEEILKSSVAKLLERCCSEDQLKLSIQNYRKAAIEPKKDS